MNVPVLRQFNTIRTDINLGGSTGAFVVEDANNELFVFKPYRRSDRWIAPNELVATLLGQQINGPFLQPYLVELDQELLEMSGLTKRPVYNYSTLEPGLGFSIQYLQNSQNAGSLPEQQLSLLSNPQQAIDILLLDSWVHNTDRNNTGNLIFTADALGKKRRSLTMYAIDQALAFNGMDWDDVELQKDDAVLQVENRLPILEKLGRKHFQTNLENCLIKVEAVSEAELKQILSHLPAQWGISDLEKEMILAYLQKRQKLLRPVFENFFGL